MSREVWRNPWAFVVTTVAALGGWGWALQQHFGDNPADHDSHTPEPAWKRSVRAGSASGFSLAGTMARPRSARLMSNLEDIAAEAPPGEPNTALIRACEESLLDGDFESRHRDFGMLLELMRPEDASALHETFLALHREGRGFVLEYSLFANQWGKIDPEGALDYLAGEDPVRMPVNDVMNVVRGWAQTDPGAALHWLEQHKDLANEKSGYTALLQGWVRTDPDAAKRYFQTAELPPAQRSEAARSLALELLYSGGIDDSTDWIASLPEDNAAEALQAWNAASIQFSELPYDTAARVWAKVADKQWMPFGLFARFSGGVANSRTNTEGAAGFIDAVSGVWPADQAAVQFARWREAEPDWVDAWFAQAPENEWVRSVRSALEE